MYSLLALLVRALPLPNIFVLAVAVSSAYVPLVALSGLVLAGISRQLGTSVLAVLTVIATFAVQLPWYYFGRSVDDEDHVNVRVLSSNLRRGQADASSFVRLAIDGADVVTVSELTPAEVYHFSQAGIDRAFPYSLLYPGPGAGGTGLWSRYPLTAVSPAEQRQAMAQLRIPGVRFDPLVVSVHITSPVARDANSFANWRNGIAATRVRLGDFAESAGPRAIIVAGDFNSTPEMRQFRDLLTNGYRDAVQQTGAGFAPTFPSYSSLPPLLTIDHVLTRQATVASVRTIVISGSDHRALLATVMVPQK